MNNGEWIQPQPPGQKNNRRWVTLASVLAGLVALLAMAGACSQFAAGVRDGYQSTTTGYTAKPTPPTRPTTPPPTVAAATVAAGALAGAVTGTSSVRAPSRAADPVVVVPADEPLSDPDPEADVNTADIPTHFSSCKAARAAGAAPLHRGEPGYSSKLDKDGDGTACEN
jgi:hypothetical protein